jgi:uncharacterized protein (DUF934 family)
MPLVKAGRIVEDRFVRVLDEAPVPEGVPVILPAARFLADARDLVLRQAPSGVIWPNDRKLAELTPYLDWIAVIALVFPSFRDGRAYSQARLLRERHGFRGELRATGQVLRDQLVFLQRAGFDAFELTKDADAAAALQRVLSTDGRRPRQRAGSALWSRHASDDSRGARICPVTSKFRQRENASSEMEISSRQTRSAPPPLAGEGGVGVDGNALSCCMPPPCGTARRNPTSAV